jgi:hypothetical protein
MNIYEAPLMSLRPSSPKVQAGREKAAARMKEARARSKLRAAMAKADGDAALPPGQSWDRVGFSKWYATIQSGGLLDGMTEGEAEAFRQVAWLNYHNCLPPEVWLKTVRAANDKRRETGISATIAWWNRQRPRSYSNEGSDGW